MLKRRILFIGGAFGKEASPNGICTHKIIKELQKQGHSVIVLAMNDGYQPDNEMFDDIPIERVRAAEMVRLEAWRRRNSTALAGFWWKFRVFLKNVRALIFLWIWPFNSPINFWLLYHKGKKIIKSEKIDTVVSVYAPFNTILAGHFLKKKYPNIKFVAYFLDSLSGGFSPRLTSQKWIIKQGRQWERFILNNADSVFIMKAHEKHHCMHNSGEAYFSKIKVLDIPLIENDRCTAKSYSENSYFSKDYINFVYLGSLKKNIKNPEWFIQAYLSANLPGVMLRFIGILGDCEKLINEACEKFPERVSVHPPVPHCDAIEILKSADVLLNIGSENSCQIPCKIFEYISTGKPIVSTFSSKEEPSIPYLKNYRNALLLNEKSTDINKEVDKLVEFFYNLPNSVDMEDLQEKYYLCTPKAFYNALSDVWEEN